MSGMKDDSMAEVAMQYNDGYNETICFLRQQRPYPEGGMHEEGLQAGSDQRAQRLRPQDQDAQGRRKVSGEDCREGLTCVISVKLTDAQFEGARPRQSWATARSAPW